MREGKRHLLQGLAALAQNARLSGFLTGTIHTGASKRLCVPGLNCYSCPGALGSCPIGSLQAVLGGGQKGISFYVTGMILLFGALLGRLVCGFLCPFGLVQDLLHKLPTPKAAVPRRLDRPLRWGKYLSLAGVLLLPVALTDAFGLGAPYFCKYLCPAGTLEGGIPLLLGSESLRGAAGGLFLWKLAVLAVILLAAVLIYRPFCKYLCPLGAVYGLMNRRSLYRMEIDRSKCTRCGACERACKMGAPVLTDLNSAECIRCGLCKTVCPADAIVSGFGKAGRAEGGKLPGKIPTGP